MAYQQQYPPQTQYNALVEATVDGDRGLSKNQKIGVGLAAAVAAAGVGYMVYKKKKKVKMADGSTREVECDPNDEEGYFVDENGQMLADQSLGHRGLGSSMGNLAHNKNAQIAAGVLAAGAVAAGGYMLYKKKKKVNQRQVMPDGSTRDVLVEVDCDPNDPEGYEVDENGQPRGVGGSMSKMAHNKNAQIAAGVVAAGAVAAGGYMLYRKKKKVSQRQIMPDGSTRDVLVEVDCDPNDPEGYEVDENGKPRGTAGSMNKLAHNKKAQIAAGVLALGAAAAGGYYIHNKRKKKKVSQRQVMPDGSTRDVMIEIDCDPNDPEGYFVEDNGQQCQQQQQQQQPMQQPMQGSPYGSPYGSQSQLGSPYGSQSQLPMQGSPYGSPQHQAPNPYAGLPAVGSNPALPPTMYNSAPPAGFNFTN
eukprot:Awhi_evm3s4512